MTGTPDSLFDSIARLLPVADREHFFRRMAHIRDLSPNDDMLQIAEAMGFLALLIRQTPPEIANERTRFEALFQDTLAALKLVNDSTLAHQRDLERRLKDLPGAVGFMLDAQNVGAMLCESIRQQLHDTALPSLVNTIAAHTQTLRKTATDFTTALDSLSDPERGAAVQLHRALTFMCSDLDNAASHVRALTGALGRDLRRALFVLCAGSLALGFLLGRFYAP